MKTIFIKPSTGQFCIAVFEHDDASIKLLRVDYADNQTEITEFLSQHKDGVESVIFDGTVY